MPEYHCDIDVTLDSASVEDACEKIAYYLLAKARGETGVLLSNAGRIVVHEKSGKA